ncbi:unnamed protein product [Acanthosepion pharaonis]|uniref:Uncharacterized protein n=1 Tax=Acanthosepion pharaonis TaxID=158019 RepID=A0A812CWE2_ACAPH|nr:unnamed protein product [Sepia pharaonis]
MGYLSIYLSIYLSHVPRPHPRPDEEILREKQQGFLPIHFKGNAGKRFPLHERFPAIVQLAVHLENNEVSYFSADTAMDVTARTKDTTLSTFFKICRWDEFSRTLMYPDVSSYYVWTKKDTWARRKCGVNVEGNLGVKKDVTLGRVFTVPPSRQEYFYLRFLLHEVSGPTSYKNLRTVNGVLYDTFREACLSRGLLEDNSHWDAIMAEGALSKCPLFAPLLHHNLTNVRTQTCLLKDGESLAAIVLSTPDRVASSSPSSEIVPETSYSVEDLNAYVTTNVPKLLIDKKVRLRCGSCIHQAGYRINFLSGRAWVNGENVRNKWRSGARSNVFRH